MNDLGKADSAWGSFKNLFHYDSFEEISLNKEVKGKNREIHRLNEELKMVTDTNDYLERKNQELQDYCNDLLNRPMVGGE